MSFGRSNTGGAIAALAAGLLVSSAGLVACTYDPKIPSDRVICDPDAGRCPAGFTCVPIAGATSGGVCTASAAPAGDGAPEVDAAVAHADASAADSPPADALARDAAAEDDASSADDAPPDLRIGEPLPAASTVADGGCFSPGRGPEMVRATDFCIDSTEVTSKQYLAFLAEADLTKQPPGCAAINPSFIPLNVDAPWPPIERDEYPVVNVDWCDAAAFCQWSGKRLCGRIGAGTLDTVQAAMPALGRWASACTRAGAQKLPYGPDVMPGRCNVGQPNRPLHILPVASMPGCQGGYDKLYDMVGNVEEWLDACHADPARGEVCAIIGGDYFDNDSVSDCGRVYDKVKTSVDYYRGFRCCWP
jgi:hypothetical protein